MPIHWLLLLFSSLFLLAQLLIFFSLKPYCLCDNPFLASNSLISCWSVGTPCLQHRLDRLVYNFPNYATPWVLKQVWFSFIYLETLPCLAVCLSLVSFFWLNTSFQFYYFRRYIVGAWHLPRLYFLTRYAQFFSRKRLVHCYIWDSLFL